MAVTPVELQKADPSWFFSNPQAIASIGDPCILRDGDGYFLYATKGGAGFYCWHTQSLHQWTGSYKTALAGTPWAQKKHWAPEVVKHDGKYVMVYSAAIAGSERMLPGIAFSCRPEGPFRAVEKPLLNLGFSAIDASLFFDDRPYLLFSRDCSEYRPGGIRQSHTYGVALKEDLLETEGNPVLLSRPELPWECLSKEPLWNEGGCILKHNATYLVHFDIVLHRIDHLLGYKSPLPGTGFFWQVNSCRIMSKSSVLHGGSLLKPPQHLAQGRHSHKGMENGGLEMYFKTAAGVKL